MKNNESSVNGWISCDDEFPAVGQIVDIWRRHDTNYQKTVDSLKDTDFGKKNYYERDLIGWRMCDMEFYTEFDDNGIIHCFRNPKSTYRQEYCVENGEISHWMPLPPAPEATKK